MDSFQKFETLLHNLNARTFEDVAMEVFKFQASGNKVYREYLKCLSIEAADITSVDTIPFLPISFFKRHTLKTTEWEPECVFTSSGTTETATSRHFVFSRHHYFQNARRCFEAAFGNLRDYHFFALLPSYLERTNSSLIAMLEYFIRESASPFSGFYLYDIDKLLRDVEGVKKDQRKTIIWGVSFALLDLAEHQPDLSHCTIIETGGMKGRKKEITRQELHTTLTRSFHTPAIFSEYGMTELLSQAYTSGNQRFSIPYSMRIFAREVTDPFNTGIIGETGGLNIIDLANFHSVAFLETEDLGKVYPDGSFEVLGRMDNSDVRGCNLLVN